MSVETVVPVQPLEQHEYIGHHRVAEEMAVAEAACGGWRQRLGMMAGRVALAVGLAGGMVVAVESVSNNRAEAAPSCYGDYCSGRYANETGCDNPETTYTVTEIDVTRRGLVIGGHLSREPGVDVNNGGENDLIGRLELRHSNECKTSWARYTPLVAGGSANIMGVNFVGIQQDSGYTQKRDIGGLFNGSPSTKSFSPMIYGEGRDYQAFVEVKNFAVAHRKGTYWSTV